MRPKAYRRVCLDPAASLVILGVILTIGCSAESHTFPPMGRSSKVVVAKKDLLVGTVWADQNFKVTLPIHNTTSDPIHITDFRTSCECTSISPSTFTIAPRETEVVDVIINLTRFADHRSSPNQTIPFEVSLQPICSEDTSIEPWTIIGEVKHALVLSNSRLTVTSSVERASKADYFPEAIEITTLASVCSLGASVESHDFLTSLVKTESGYRLRVSPRRPLKAGIYSSLIELHATLSDSETVTRQMPLTVEVEDELVFLPSTVSFPPAKVGSVLKASVATQANSIYPVVFVRVVNRVDGFEVSGDSASPIIRITQKVTKEGSFSDTARLEFLVGDDLLITTSLPIAYFGLPSEGEVRKP